MVLSGLACCTGSPRAVSFPVTKTADTNDGTCDADCSLREAIVAANAAAGPDTISVPAGTYTLSIASTGEDAAADGDLDITESVTITGAGVGATIIDANDIDRIFHVLFGATGVQISDLTITNGLVPSFGRGGGLQNHGTLTLTNVVLSNSGGFNGGGIANDQGTLTLNNSTIQGNTTTGNSGAGIINDTGQLTINASTISDNTTPATTALAAVSATSAVPSRSRTAPSAATPPLAREAASTTRRARKANPEA